MADHRITDFVDQQAIDSLKNLNQQMQMVKVTYIEVAKELVNGLNMKVSGMDDLQRLMDLLQKNQAQAAQATQNLTHSIEERNKALQRTTAVIAEELQESEKANRAVRQSGVEHDKVKKLLEQINGTYENNVKNLIRTEAELRKNKDAQKALAKEYEAGAIRADEYEQRLLKLTIESRELATEKANLTSLLKNEEKEMQSAEGSYNHMSQQLELLKKTYKAMTQEETQSPLGRDMAEAINQLDTELKHMAESMGEHQRNVGDYAIATQNVKGDLRELVMEIASLTVAYRSMSQEEQATADGIALRNHIGELTEKAGELRDAVSDTNEAIKNAASDTRGFDQITGGVQMMIDGFGLASGAAGMLGVSEGELVEMQTKLQASMAASNALSKIQANLQKQSAVMQAVANAQTKAAAAAEAMKAAAQGKGVIATKAATVAQKAFNLVASANPYVLLAIAVVSVAGALWLFASRTDDAAKAQERLNDALDDCERKMKSVAEESDFAIRIAEAAGEGEQALRRMRVEAAKTQQQLAELALQNLYADGNATQEQIQRAQENLAKADELVLSIIQDNIVAEMKENTKREKEEERHNAELAKAYAERVKAAQTMAQLEMAALSFRKESLSAQLDAVEEYSDEWVQIMTDMSNTTLNIEISNIKNSLEKQLAAAKESFEVRKITQEEYDTIIAKLQSDAADRIEALTKKTNDEIAGLDRQLQEHKKDVAEKEIENIEDRFAAEQAIANAAYAKTLNSLKKQRAEGLITEEAYQKKAADLAEAYSLQTAQAAIEMYRKILDSCDLTADLRADIEAKLAQAQIDLDTKVADNAVAQKKREEQAEKDAAEAAKKAYKERLEGAQKWLQQISQGLSAITGLANAIYEGKVEAIEKEQEAGQEAADKENQRIADMVEKNVITEEEGEARKRAAEAKTAKKQEELEKKKQELKHKQAVWDKANQLAQAGINTAASIVASAKMGFPAAIPFVAMAAALGALQMATIVATPIPKYAKGTGYHKGGLAVVGDGGKAELVEFGGRMFITPDTPTLVDMPKGATVHPDADSIAVAINALTEARPISEGAKVVVNNDYDRLERKMGETNELIRSLMRQQKSQAYYSGYQQYKRAML